MDLVLKDLIGDELHVFIDDVIIFSKTAEEHAARLEHVLERFDKANLQLQKCMIARPKVNYLGYVLSQDGITASPDKVKAVRNYPTPANVKDVRAFLGLASYRRLVPDFAELSKHLTVLTKKDHEFRWGPDQQEAFEKLKVRLWTTPVLAYPDFSQPFILTKDANKVAVAAVLSQLQEGVERPLAYACRQLTKTEASYSASETEMLALVWAAKHFRCYLYTGNLWLGRITQH